MSERHAIFYAPATQSPLWQRAAQWLGRDATGREAAGAAIAGIDPARRLALTESARRYGFHATIKAPMTLPQHQSVGELEKALTAFGLKHWPVTIGELAPRMIGGFLALTAVPQPQELNDLAAKVVDTFEPFRAPLAPADRERRLAAGLTDRQIELVVRYGYPYVLEEFLFHMTLTDRLPEAERDTVIAAATDWFAPVLQTPVTIDRLTLFHEPQSGAAFVRLGDYPLLSEVRL